MLSSRLVADRRRRGPSVASRMLLRMGIVLRVDTARLTTARPLLRLSCGQVSFTAPPLLFDHSIRTACYQAVGPNGSKVACLDARWAKASGTARACRPR